MDREAAATELQRKTLNDMRDFFGAPRLEDNESITRGTASDEIAERIEAINNVLPPQRNTIDNAYVSLLYLHPEGSPDHVTKAQFVESVRDMSNAQVAETIPGNLEQVVDQMEHGQRTPTMASDRQHEILNGIARENPEVAEAVGIAGDGKPLLRPQAMLQINRAVAQGVSMKLIGSSNRRYRDAQQAQRQQEIAATRRENQDAAHTR